MRVFTQRLGQFAVCALLSTIVFRYTLNLAVGMESLPATSVCSIVYFGLMFFAGWYFGSKDEQEHQIHDIGFRFHLVTYILCIAMGYAAYFIGWNTEPLKSMNIGAIAWGIGLALHFVFFLFAQKNAIRGYAKEEIFQ
ncbi:MAG: hypothetical protein IJE52_03420 [Bacteroidales bacterium]|nr:hypothetical protein [Bacteroidales bacterium]